MVCQIHKEKDVRIYGTTGTDPEINQGGLGELLEFQLSWLSHPPPRSVQALLSAYKFNYRIVQAIGGGSFYEVRGSY